MTASTASGMRFQVATDVARQAAASLIACLTRLTDTLGLVTMASCPLIRPSVKDMRVDSSVGKRNEVLRSLASPMVCHACR